MVDFFTSQYLNIYPSHRDSCILFHGITGAIDEVTRSLGQLLKKHQRSKSKIETSLPDAVIEFLVSRGHLTKMPPQEEWAFFKSYATELHKNVLEKAQDALSSFLIIPSYHCNLACPYCFQKQNVQPSKIMTPKTADLIFEQTVPELFANTSRLSRVQVTLYGGEPFLPPHRQVINRILKHTQRLQMRVNAVSNGTQLHHFKDCFGLEKGLVSQIQITFDGDPATHDASRVTKSGKGTFNGIIKNIHDLIDAGVSISLRVNTNPNNVKGLTDLWERLNKEEITTNSLVHLYLAPIHDFDKTQKQPVFTSKHKLTHVLEKMKSPLPKPQEEFKLKFKNVFEADSGIVLNTTFFCMHNTGKAFVFDPFHNIYSCYEEAGDPQWAVGRFDNQGHATLNQRHTKCLQRNVANIDICSRCSLALSCGGGCAVCAKKCLSKNDETFGSACEGFKEMTAKTIRELFRDRDEGQLKFELSSKTNAIMPRV